MVLLILSAAGSVAQDRTWSWSIGGGPSMALANGRLFPQRHAPTGSSFTFDEPFVSAAENGEFNLLLGVARRLQGSALTARLDWLYNRATSAPKPFAWQPGPIFTTIPARPALLDEFHAVGLGLDWDARPGKSRAPYLLTSAGWLKSRSGWNPDSSSAVVTENVIWRSSFIAGGIGFRAPLLGRQLFVEWRRLTSLHGGVIPFAAPLTIGTRFLRRQDRRLRRRSSSPSLRRRWPSQNSSERGVTIIHEVGPE
jgi:hypothetical protein